MARGQVTLEAVVAILILMITLVLILSQLGERSGRLEFMKTSGVQKTECLALQSAISIVQSVEQNAELEAHISYDANLSGKSINFGGFYCYFNGNEINAELHAGNVTVKKVGGVVSVENN